MSKQKTMPLADYLASEAAREDVRKRLRGEPSYFTRFLDGGRVWHGMRCNKCNGEFSPTIYYRPDGERYTVTDLGGGVKAKRLRTGDLTQPAFEPRICWQYGDVLGVDKITAADLPDAICRVMLASLRVAQS